MPVDVTKNYIRIRIKSPSLFQKDSFRTIDISKSRGIKAVIGKLRGKSTTTVQSYLFDRTKWSVKEAKKWIKDHKSKGEFNVQKTLVTANMNLIALGVAPIGEVLAYAAEHGGELPMDETRIFFESAELCHAGVNKNFDMFLEEDLVKNYKTAETIPVDWEHILW